MEEFIIKGGEITDVNENGFTCLHIAARCGHARMVNLLLAKGADENVRDKFGYNPAYWAKKEKRFDILEMLPPPAKRTQ